MIVTLENQVNRWLHQLRIPVSVEYLKQQLLSHPDYPSLLSITDTLYNLTDKGDITFFPDQYHGIKKYMENIQMAIECRRCYEPG